VKQGLLTSVVDPTVEIATAADLFGDEYTPMIYMTGDAHRTPPFQWTTRPQWAGLFTQAVDSNVVCCHVETFEDEVRRTVLPDILRRVHQNGKVFATEPEVFRTLLQIMRAIMEVLPELAFNQPQSQATIRYLANAMWRVRDMGYMRGEADAMMAIWDQVRSRTGVPKPDPVPVAATPTLLNLLRNYNQDAMQLRTGIHPVIGAMIQRRIVQYPDHIHLITCGDAHIIDNPLYNYIQPPAGTFGIADQNQR
jgi:hypothetical protein